MIEDNISKIRERISLNCLKINRPVDSIRLVAVSKNRTPEQVKQAVAAGISDIGENKVQEALAKVNKIRSQPDNGQRIKWHLVGHLQTNKVKQAVRIFDLIQSVDSIKLAEEIDKQSKKINKIQDVLIEVNTSGESSKYGFSPDETIEVIRKISNLSNINIKGLMTIAPIVDAPEKTRPYFKMLRELRDKINEYRVSSIEYQVLSMGMTDDFEIAIEEGANMVRIGRAIFEK